MYKEIRRIYMVTIKDIAAQLGIAPSTVSKGLNGANDISEELRQQVLDTAIAMGYKTKKMKNKTAKSLCLFIENMEYELPEHFGYDIIIGFKQMALRENWSITIKPFNPYLQSKEKYDNYMLRHGYRGAFLVGFALQDDWMQQLEHTTIPTVLLDNYIPQNPKVNYVGTDSQEGIQLAVDHLKLLGHTKIAFLNGSPNSMITVNREMAFRSAMENANLPLEENLIQYGYYVSDCRSEERRVGKEC